MNIEEALNQSAAGTAATGNAGDAAAGDIAGQGGSTEAGGNQSKAGSTLPPELQEKEKELMRAFHEKTQALAEEKRVLSGQLEEYKKDAVTLYDLAKQEWFKAAVEAEKSRRAGRVTEITPERFEVLKSDPAAFQDYLSKRDQAVAERLKAEFRAEFDRLGKGQQELSTSREFDRVAGDYGEEFTRASNTGALRPYLEKNLDYETAFKLYMQDQGKVAVKKGQTKPAEQVDPNKQRAGTVERGGMTAARGGPVVKAGSLNEALDRAFDLLGKGTKDFRFER